MSLTALRAAPTIGDSVMPRFGGTAFSATKNGRLFRRATAIVAGSEARSNTTGRVGIKTSVAAFMIAPTSSPACAAPSMKTHSMVLWRRAVSSTSGSSAARGRNEERRARAACPVPHRKRALRVGVDQERRRLLAVGERREIDRKGALAGSALLRSNRDDIHCPAAPVPAGHSILNGSGPILTAAMPGYADGRRATAHLAGLRLADSLGAAR